MVKLVPKKTSKVKNHKVIVSQSEEISEVFISAGGSFGSQPIWPSAAFEAFRLPSSDRQNLLDEGYRLWKYDALGGTIVSLTTYFVLGRGITFVFDEEKVQEYAKKFYCKNKLEMKLRSASDESVAFGEVFIWLRPKFSEIRRNGKVLWRLGDTQVTFIRPDNITDIETADEDVGNVFSYWYRYIDANQVEQKIQIPDISKYDFDGANRENGCMVHIKLNSGNMDPFGHSDLIRVKEWLDNYQEYLRDGVVINKLYRSPCYDVTIENATQSDIDEATARYRGWKIGSNPVHSDKETWQILEFRGPNTSSENARRALLLIIAAGVGFAEYMLADGANANLASTKSQQLPVIKKFEDRQDIFAYYMMEIFQFAIMAKAKIAPEYGIEIEVDSEGDPIPFRGKVEFPAIVKDSDKEIAETNKIGIEGGWMSPRTAAGRSGLDYGEEVNRMLNDAELLKKLKQIGINVVIGTPPEPAPMNGASRNGSTTSVRS